LKDQESKVEERVKIDVHQSSRIARQAVFGQKKKQRGVFCVYQYFVALGLFLASWQAIGVFSDVENAGSTCLQQKSKETLFPESTNYR
jgi:hypothetical protein